MTKKIYEFAVYLVKPERNLLARFETEAEAIARAKSANAYFADNAHEYAVVREHLEVSA